MSKQLSGTNGVPLDAISLSGSQCIQQIGTKFLRHPRQRERALEVRARSRIVALLVKCDATSEQFLRRHEAHLRYVAGVATGFLGGTELPACVASISSS